MRHRSTTSALIPVACEETLIVLYMIELHFNDKTREGALNYFWKHGSNHYDGNISVVNLWVASQDQVAYALIQSREQEEVDKALRRSTNSVR